MGTINEVLYENIDYGAYILDYEAGTFEENVKYATAEFNKLHVRKVRLPEGKGNIVYLLADTFEHSLNMINAGTFIVPPTYRKIYYPWFSVGTFMGRRYKVSTMNLKNQRSDMILKKTKLRPFTTRNIPNGMSENIIFSTADIYGAVKPIMQRFPVKKNYDLALGQFVEIIRKLSPEGTTTVNKNVITDGRVLIIDASSFNFKNGAPLEENKTNPLYLLYLAFLRNRNLTKLGVDMDMMVCSRNMFMKFNPAKLTMDSWAVFRRAMFRIVDANLDDYTNNLSADEKNEIDLTAKDHMISSIVNDVIDPYTKMVSPATKAVVADAVEASVRKQAAKTAILDKAIKDEKKAVADTLGVPDKPNLFTQSLNTHNKPVSLINTNPVVDPLDKKREGLFKAVGGAYQPLGMSTGKFIDDELDEEDPDEFPVEEYEDEIKDDVQEVLTSDEEVMATILDEIQDQTAPITNLKTAPISSARDKKLREAQKKVVVKTETIEEILQRDATNVPIETSDKSAVMHTTNQNMQQVKFANFDKTYIDQLMAKDIVACFDMLKDQNPPFYITNIDIKDTSTIMDLKETWTVSLVDEAKRKHTIKVDIPKFQNDRFMLIDGTKYIILKQNFYNPLVKDTPDTVILTTNFNKITIDRKATKSLTTVERIFALIRKTGDTKVFVTGDSTRGNLKYISSLEYDEISRRLFKFTSGNCELYFSRDYIQDNLADRIPKNIGGNEFFIGFEGTTPVMINEDTGMDRSGRTIADIIEANLSDDYQAIFKSIKPPAQSMYAEGKLAGEMIPIIATLLVWEGLSNTLSKMKIRWKFDPDAKRVPVGTTTSKYIRFADGVLEYEAKTFAELILNGLSKLHPEKKKFSDFDTEEGYHEYIYSQWGSYNGITELKSFKAFLVDPITKDVCKNLSMPTDPSELLIYAVKLLCDNAFISKASDNSYRTRSIEMIPAILHSCLAIQYKNHIKSGRRLPMTLNQRAVITKLIAEKTVEPYSTLNPVIEVSKTHTISTKGYKGSNSDHSYDEEKRSYDPSSVGKLAISTSADANVGINKALVIEPTIANARGYRDQVEDVDTLKDVNIFSPVEMLTPGTSRNEDPIRTAIAGKQSQHVVPVADASPSLVSNGFDEAVQFHLSDDFVINAEEDGEVVDVNEELGFIVVRYKSGKTKAISTKTDVVKNSGGGFYIANQLKPTRTKVGEKFKKDEPLAYHDKYFRYSRMNGLRYAIGPIVKMAIMSSYNTYEDAGICTESLAERMKTSIVYRETGKFKKNNNILSMVKVGDTVNIGDALIKFDVSVEDNELAKYLSKLSEENASILEEETKNEIKTMHAGRIIDIKVYTLLDPTNLSPSLGAIVQQYFDKGNAKRDFLGKYDSSGGVVKAGYMITDSTEPIVNRYNSIKGNKGIDVLIEIFIEHDDVMAVGDKIALYSANKQIISEVIPKGYEPYSESRPDEEISVMTSPGTIARRMTPAVIPISAAMKVQIELKRKIKSEIKYK